MNILFTIPMQKGNFCFPTSLDSLLNNIFKEANLSRSLKEILQWKVLVKAESEIGKSLLIKLLVLAFYFVILSTTLELHPWEHPCYMGSVTEIYHTFSFTRFSAA